MSFEPEVCVSFIPVLNAELFLLKPSREVSLGGEQMLQGFFLCDCVPDWAQVNPEVGAKSWIAHKHKHVCTEIFIPSAHGDLNFSTLLPHLNRI